MRTFRILPGDVTSARLYWRPGERGGSLEADVGGTLANNGAPFGPEGMVCDGAGYAVSPAITLAAPATAITLECWLRGWGYTPAEDKFSPPIGAWIGSSDYLRLYVRRRPTASLSFIRADQRVGGGTVASATLQSAVADALLASADWHHVAAVLNGSTLSLYIDGALAASQSSGVAAMAAGNYVVSVGATPTGGDLSKCAALDEVRWSTVARYTAAFTPLRYVETGLLEWPHVAA